MSSSYASTADGRGHGRYGIDKLIQGNYANWRWNCQALLEENKVWGYVAGTIVKPKAADESSKAEDIADSVRRIDEWIENDKAAWRIIGYTVSGGLLGTVRRVTSSKEAWDGLEKLHAPNDKQ